MLWLVKHFLNTMRSERGDFGGGNKDEGDSIETKVVEDPYKTGVSSPLSTYLASQIGKGLPAYTGKLTAPLDPQEVSNLTKYLSLDPNEWFTKNIQDPTVASWKETGLPLVNESFAGNLRGSGRYAGVEGSLTGLERELAVQRGTTVPKIAESQYGLASQYSQLLSKNYATEYAAWLQTLPEFNPALKDAISFLGADSGYDVIAGTTTPNTSGAQLAGAGIQTAGSIASAMILATALASDIRLKDNVEKIGVTNNGLGVYKWDWKKGTEDIVNGSPNTGVIAQEVMNAYPDAVAVGDHGYLMVDYSKIGG